MLLLGRGDGDAHDNLIAAEARKLPGTFSSICVLLIFTICITQLLSKFLNYCYVPLNPEDCSVVCLAQYSMARAAPLVRDALKRGSPVCVSTPVLTSPDSAVAKLVRMSKSALDRS